MRITHIITGLGVGGAEMMLLKLLKAHACKHQALVISLVGHGPIAPRIEALGISVFHLGANGPMDFPGRLPALRRLLRQARPEVVQGWMYHGNLAALAGTLGRRVPVAWNIRSSLHRPDLFKPSTRRVVQIGAKLSKYVDRVIFNSRTSLQQHIDFGFRSRNLVFIPNGFDAEHFRPDPERREKVRRQLGLHDRQILAIAVGREHPMKGHRQLLAAIQKSIRARSDLRFAIVGRSVQWENAPFTSFATDKALKDRVLLWEERDDIADLLAAADVFVNPSLSEGFPNVVVEAMLTELPCIVTDVGDSAEILDGHGSVVPPDNVNALSRSIIEWAHKEDCERRRTGANARAVAQDRFSIGKIADAYTELYVGLSKKTVGAVEGA